jgi:hypothetical protein
MTVKFVKSIPFTVCKSRFLFNLADPESLPQCKELNEFVVKHGIENISKLIINDQYCSLDELTSKITSAREHDCEYMYLALNKFYIYTTIDTLTPSAAADYDFKLIKFCYNLLSDQYVLMKYTTEPNDYGKLGNFVHPVTTMFLKKHA